MLFLIILVGCSTEDKKKAIQPECGSQISNFEKDVETFIAENSANKITKERKKQFNTKFDYHKQQIKIHRSETPLSEACLQKYEALRLKLDLDSSLKKHNMD